jgi:hypothetical protein
MSQDEPSPPSPDAPSDHRVNASALNVAFDAMLLNPTFVAGGNFSDNWGATDTKEALALSSVNDTQLKDCISAASASVSVWGIPTMRRGSSRHVFVYSTPTAPIHFWLCIGQGGGRLTYSAPLG